MPPPNDSRIIPAAGLLWIVAVLTSYYTVNGGYYFEKISVFIRVLARFP